MAFNFGTSILPTNDNTFSLGSSTKRWRINDSIIPTFDAIYPIGSIYMSINSTDPSNLFGGTWEQITGKFLLACDTTYEAGTIGGSATMDHTHILAHTHSQVAVTSGGPSNNTSGGNNNATAGPSNNTSGSTSLSVAQMPSHNHGSAGAHTHQAGDIWFVYDAGSWANRYGPSITTQNTPLVDAKPGTITNSAGAHTHSSNGSGSGHTHTLSSHTHTMSSHTHTLSSHTHSIAATTTGAASNTTTSAASNNNNMPPYLAVYVWQRVA